MDSVSDITPKAESSESLLTCKFCLAPQSAARLARRDLTAFYAVFRGCGLGLHIMEPIHYNWVCQYCWVRTTQCLSFVKSATNAEYVLNTLFENENVTEEKLRRACEEYITPPVQLTPCIIGYLNTDNDNSDQIYTAASTSPDNSAHVTILETDQSVHKYQFVNVCIPFADKSNQFADKSSPFADKSNPFAGNSNQFADKSNPFADNSKQFADKSNPFAEYSNQFDGTGNRFIAIEQFLPVRRKSKRNKKKEIKVDTKYALADDSEGPLGDSEELWAGCKLELAGGSDGKKVKKSGGKSSERQSVRARKDPAELAARWRSLQVQVMNLSEEQQRRELAERRATQRYRDWRFKCDKCAVGFHELECIEKHMMVHDESRGAFKCKICEVRFATNHQLSSHAGAHRRRWRCTRCGAVISKSSQVAPHHAECTGDAAPVACQQCGRLFKNALRLSKHVSKLHNTRRQLVCDVCGRAFREKQQIKYHMRTHTGEMPHACDICGKKSATSTAHRLHMSVHQTDTRNPELYCVECNRYFKNKYILRIHFKTTLKHNSKLSFKHACTECDERFYSAGGLRAHTEGVHLNRRAQQCPLCDKAYYTRSALSAHTKEKHSGKQHTRDFTCHVCSKAFVTASQLKAHSRIHTKERPYACLLCPATFSFNSALYTHTKLKHKMTTAEVKKKLGVGKQD